VSQPKTPPASSLALPWKSLAEYIEEQRAARGQTRKALALAIGLEPGHLWRILAGEIQPGPEICRRIAAFFQIPLLMVFQLAGIVQPEDWEVPDGGERFMLDFARAAAKDPDLRALYELYLEQPTRADRRAFVRVVRAAFGRKGKSHGS